MLFIHVPSFYYGTFILEGGKKTVKIQKPSWASNVHGLSNSSKNMEFFAFLHSWFIWYSKFKLLLICIPKSLTLSSYLGGQLEIWISKFSLELTRRHFFSFFLFDIKLLLWNHPNPNSFAVFRKFKSDKNKVWWTGIRCIVISIISIINVTIFKKEVTLIVTSISCLYYYIMKILNYATYFSKLWEK